MSSICRQRMGFSRGMSFAPKAAVMLGAAAALVLAAPVLAQQSAPPPSPATPRPAAPKPATTPPATTPAAAQKPPSAQGAVSPGPGEPTLLAMFGEWGAYTATPGGKKVCFALAKPVSSSTVPPNRPRDPAWMFISTRPSERVTNEVSVTFGYGLKPNTDATLQIAGGTYAMNTQGDGAWVKNPAEEPKLIDVLRKGADVTVKGTSAKGTVSTDVFSLKGLAQALDKIGRECR